MIYLQNYQILVHLELKAAAFWTQFWRMRSLSSFFILVFSWFADVIKVSNLILALLQCFSWADQINCIFSFFPTWNSICWLQFLKVCFRSTPIFLFLNPTFHEFYVSCFDLLPTVDVFVVRYGIAVIFDVVVTLCAEVWVGWV